MLHRRLRLVLIAAMPLCAACAPFPKVPGPEGDPGDFPALLPIDDLVAQADGAGTDP